MHIHYISLFPDIFQNFEQTSIIAKAVDRGLLHFSQYNPRDNTSDWFVDDTIYGGGAGMLIQAEPVIQSIEQVLSYVQEDETYLIIFPSPSETVFNQSTALEWSSYDHLIFINGRYEGIDHRVQLRCEREHADHFVRISLGSFILLGGEVASMTMTEAVVRLIPDVIKESASRQQESYSPLQGMRNIEEPQYTRPLLVRWLDVPEYLLQK